ncbi:AEC family transporter [Oscillatoria sp. FACHB-1407]|uniref:AEC family transporter n=1 Tax=Oscillatoria sp. FACHB-1407 TaxID=2692847 RepID=UPI001689BC15|nr:AEC family transporter [Oscillatoria sp. FACHB-1407]MBD2460438.1 AEC family transporter [Oscillatoria sp. FACHB-1407]
MSTLGFNLIKLYVPLVTWVGLGILLGRALPQTVPLYLGKFLFWIGVPISIVTFLRQADLSGSVWVAPAVAWTAMLTCATLAWGWIQLQRYFKRRHQQRPRLGSAEPISQKNQPSGWLNQLTPWLQADWSRPAQGSFLLAAMVGNTGYLGYPVTLALVGPQYFAWALFYDTLGSTLGAYGLGVAIAARFGMSTQNHWRLLQAMISNPGLWSFFVGLGFRSVALPSAVEQGLRVAAWGVIALSLLLLGMRLSQLTSWRNVQRASLSLGIKMLIVPLLLGIGLSYLGITGAPQLVIVLQMAMPPAFATLVIAEAYDLDRDLTVTALAIGSLGLLTLLPLWLWLFAT